VTKPSAARPQIDRPRLSRGLAIVSLILSIPFSIEAIQTGFGRATVSDSSAGSLVALGLLLGGSLRVIVLARKLGHEPGELVLASDPRPPVLDLRRFRWDRPIDELGREIEERLGWSLGSGGVGSQTLERRDGAPGGGPESRGLDPHPVSLGAGIESVSHRPWDGHRLEGLSRD
jgi:hypothetical protein